MPPLRLIATRTPVLRHRALSPAALLLTLTAPLFGQTAIDGAIRGRLISPGFPLPPGATVRITRDADQWQQELTPNREALFTALHLSSGTYTMRAELLGSSISCPEQIDVSAGELSEVTLTATPGASSTCAASAAEAPANRSSDTPPLELDRGAHDATLAGAPSTDTESDDLDDTAANRERSNLAAAGPAIEGLSPTASNTLLDGLSAQQNFRSSPRGSNTPRTAAEFGASSVRSFRVLPRTFSAQFGGAAGGIIAVTSRGQTQHFHGSLFLLDRQSALAATNPFSLVTHYNNGAVSTALLKPTDTGLQLGASAGLPIPVSHGPLQHASIFGSLEAQLRQSQIVSTPSVGNFFALTSEQNALLANRGVTGTSVSRALNFLDGLTGPQDRRASRLLGFARLDLVPTPRQQATFGYIGNRFDTPSGSGASDAVISRGRASVADSIAHIDAFTGRWLFRLSPRTIHELRSQFAHDLEFDSPHAPLPQEPSISLGGFAPQVSIAPNGFSYGTPASTGRLAWPDEHRIQLADSLTLARGRHMLTFGADWSRIHDRIAAATDSYGSFLYDSGTTKGRDGGLADWITDYTFNVHAYPNGACPSINATVHLFCFRSFTQSFATSATEFATHDIAVFAEDSLRLPNSLSLTIGVRYDYTLLPPPQNPNPALDAILNTIGSPAPGATSRIPEDRNNFGPRISLAYSPTGAHGFTARLGYGVFYGRLPGATVNAALADTALASSTRRIRITPSTETLCPQVANQGFGYPCAYTSAPPAAIAQTSSAVVFSRSFRMPAVQRATLTLEHNSHHLQISAGYAMSIATQLPQSVDLNVAPSHSFATFMLQGGDGHAGLFSGQSFSVPLYTARRSTAFGPIAALISNANATYDAFTAETRLHPSHPFQIRAAYTFSRAIDYGPQLSATPRRNGQFDPFTNGYDKGLSSLNVRHRLSGELTLRSSLRQGPELLRRGITGFNISSIGIVSSGAPYSYEIFGGDLLSGGHESINGSGGATYLPTLGRNTLHLPLRSKLDLRFGRDFRLREHLRLNAFAESFNLLNTQSFSRVETRAFLVGTPGFTNAPTPLIFQDRETIASEGLTTPPFGSATSSSSGASRERQLQLGLRLEF